MVETGRGREKFPRLAAALLLLLVAAGAAAAEAPGPPDPAAESLAAPAPPERPEPPAAIPAPGPAQKPGAGLGPMVERIDEAHELQCLLFGELVGRIDGVFGEVYVSDREHKVQARAGGETTFNDRGVSTGTAINLALRVPLPTLERRLNVFLDIGEDVNELGSASSPDFANSQKNLSLGAGLLGRIGENAEAGLKLNLFWDDGSFASIYPFVRFEWLRLPLRYYLQQRLTWGSDDTWTARADFDVDRTLGGEFFLRFRNRADYTFGDPGAQVAHGLILRQSVFARSGLSYEVWFEYDTGPDDPEALGDDTIAYAQVRWRGRVWRDWLEYEVRPAYTVPFENGRNPFASLLVSLTVIWDSYLGGGAAR